MFTPPIDTGSMPVFMRSVETLMPSDNCMLFCWVLATSPKSILLRLFRQWPMPATAFFVGGELLLRRGMAAAAAEGVPEERCCC